LHLGDHNISCGICAVPTKRSFEESAADLSKVFESADFAATFAALERDFGPYLYTLRDLFRDEQREILDIVLESTLQDAQSSYRQLYDYHAPLLRFLNDLEIPPPRALYTAAEFILNLGLREVFEKEDFDLETARGFLDEVAMEGISLEETSLEIAVRRKIEELMERVFENPKDTALLQWLDDALDIQAELPFEVNLRKAQNRYYEMLQKEHLEPGQPEAADWWEQFKSVGRKLSFRIQ
jgi:hypothetical protein